MTLPRTPLEPVATGALPHLYLKREDLLPYGGGNKVRRFLHFLARRPACRHVAALSDRGAQTFGVLAQMVADERLPLEGACFYERAVDRNPFREAQAAAYERVAGVRVVRGRTLPLWLRWQRDGLRREPGGDRLRIGGRIVDSDGAYAAVFDECLEQLAESGHAAERVVHVLPVASGDMARAFLRRAALTGRSSHEVCGTLTGPGAARGLARLRRRFQPGLRLFVPARLAWGEYLEAEARCFDETGVHLDPVHAIHAWRALDERRDLLAGATVVLWITCMHLSQSPSGPLEAEA